MNIAKIQLLFRLFCDAYTSTLHHIRERDRPKSLHQDSNLRLFEVRNRIHLLLIFQSTSPHLV